MKLMLKLCLAITLLNGWPWPAPAADLPAAAPRSDVQPARTPIPETAAQKDARHDREAQQAAAKIAEISAAFPLLTAPGWPEKRAQFLAALPAPDEPPRLTTQRRTPNAGPAGQPFPSLPLTPLKAPSPREADLARMRKQADQVVAAHPELRDYVEQQFQWHRRMLELRDQFPGNPRVKNLVRDSLTQSGGTPSQAPAAK